MSTGRLRPRNLQSAIRSPAWRIGENQSASVRQSGGCGLSELAFCTEQLKFCSRSNGVFFLVDFTMKKSERVANIALAGSRNGSKALLSPDPAFVGALYTIRSNGVFFLVDFTMKKSERVANIALAGSRNGSKALLSPDPAFVGALYTMIHSYHFSKESAFQVPFSASSNSLGMFAGLVVIFLARDMPPGGTVTLLILCLSLAPLVVNVNPNLNVILTACLTVYVGCYRSVKPTPPSETMSNEHAMRFPLVGSAMLLSLFLLFKFLSKDLVNAVLTCYFFVLGIVALSATLLPAISRFLPKHWNEDLIIWRFPYFRSLEVEFTRSQIVAAIPGTFFCAWYASQKHWLANNILGLAFCVQGIEMLSLGSFKTGAILLAGLFVYDIFWVFFTPVMVSVAKSFDAPIKLLFPTGDSARPFSMLGLGDIVIPGIFVALALRFDVSRRKESQYFKSAFLGYTAGLVLTIIVMNWFQAAQPALLYIVPAVIGFLAAHCIWNGDVKQLLEFDESKTASEDCVDKSVDKSSKKVE
ncbi:hypothetical protein TEA_006339 [Camellia sinensis var. sinensis]|uniref:Uncharacterized protein n=1 Tax=Camellia sinensis var. sinensis TaxID=542762 RepID=A0A4S4DQ15_CAMSN|nr:hypothetical protein TEA_006339 [Camellia sinensis var. sinensis]